LPAQAQAANLCIGNQAVYFFWKRAVVMLFNYGCVTHLYGNNAIELFNTKHITAKETEII